MSAARLAVPGLLWCLIGCERADLPLNPPTVEYQLRFTDTQSGTDVPVYSGQTDRMLAHAVEVIFESRNVANGNYGPWIPTGPGRSVEWTASEGVTVLPIDAVTVSDGRARARVSFGRPRTYLGPQYAIGTLTATVLDVQRTYRAQATLYIYRPELRILSGNGQRALAATPLPQPIVLQLVTNSAAGPAEPIPGVELTFHVNPFRDGVVDRPLATTDADGRVELRWTLGYSPFVFSESQSLLVRTTVPEWSSLYASLTATAVEPLLTLQRVAGDRQSGSPGGRLRDSLALRVLATDPQGGSSPVPAHGVVITWRTADGGSVTSASTQTDAQGLTHVWWTLGAQPGTQTLRAFRQAEQPARDTVVFTASAGGLKALRIVAGDGQRDVPGAVLSPITVEYVQLNPVDGSASPLVDAPIDWSVTSGGGSVSTAATRTDAQGRATTVWTLGPAAGPQTLQAATPPDPAAPSGAVFVTMAQATAVLRHSLRVVGGNAQTGSVGNRLDHPLEVELVGVNPATGSTTPLSGIDIAWTVSSGGGTAAPGASVTDARGRASTSWSLGPAVGAQTLVAAAPSSGGAPGSVYTAGFSATAAPPAWLAYALIQPGSIPQVQPGSAFNASGGNITVRRVSEGAYEFVAAGAGSNGKVTALVTQYTNTSNFCKLHPLGVANGNVSATVHCFGINGYPAETAFAIAVMDSLAMAGRYVFAHADQRSNPVYSPASSESFNPRGPLTITRVDIGDYLVRMTGNQRTQAQRPEAVLLSARGAGNARCSLFDTFAADVIRVRCWDSNVTVDAPRVDEEFAIMLAESGRIGQRGAVAFVRRARQPGSRTLPADSAFSTGGPILVERTAVVGRSRVTFVGLGRAHVNARETVHVSGIEDDYPSFCAIEQWHTTGANLEAIVQCYHEDGDLADMSFYVILIE